MIRSEKEVGRGQGGKKKTDGKGKTRRRVKSEDGRTRGSSRQIWTERGPNKSQYIAYILNAPPPLPPRK
jgi:hypothetical protein